MVPNAVFSSSAADVAPHSKPAVKIVPNNVFEGSRNLQLDPNGRGVRGESDCLDSRSLAPKESNSLSPTVSLCALVVSNRN